MTTEAEIAAGQILYLQNQDLVPVDWDTIDAEDQAAWIRCAMAIVSAYQRAAWREPTDDDLRSRKPMLVTNQYLRGGDEWSPWRGPTVSEWYMRSDRFDRVRIQGLPPLPEPVEAIDVKL